MSGQRKFDISDHMTITLDSALHDRVRFCATKKQLSKSEYVRIALQNYMHDQTTKTAAKYLKGLSKWNGQILRKRNG